MNFRNNLFHKIGNERSLFGVLDLSVVGEQVDVCAKWASNQTREKNSSWVAHVALNGIMQVRQRFTNICRLQRMHSAAAHGHLAVQKASIVRHWVNKHVGNDLVNDLVNIVLHCVVLRCWTVQPRTLQNDLAEAVNRGDGRLIKVGQELFQVGNRGQSGFFGGEHGRHPLMFKFLIPQMEECLLRLLSRFLAQFCSCRDSKRHQEKLVGA